MILEQLGYITEGEKWLAFPLRPYIEQPVIEYFYRVLGFTKINDGKEVIDRNNEFNVLVLQKMGGAHRPRPNNPIGELQEVPELPEISPLSEKKAGNEDVHWVFTPAIELNYLFATINTLMLYNDKYRKKPLTDKKISASDIAMYSFCPAAFSISKSYETPSTAKIQYGTNFHEQARLLKLAPDGKKIKDVSAEKPKYINSTNEAFFLSLKNSEILYAGHTIEGKEKYFIYNNFIGQPDYIFRDDNGKYFVVEEKFREARPSFGRSRDKDVLYKNHKLQLAAYIYGIKEYPIEYGFLVYWEYGFDIADDGSRSPRIDKCSVFKVSRDRDLRVSFNNHFDLVTKFYQASKNGEGIPFDPSTQNLNKCVACSVAGICRHKNGSYKEVTLPYYNGGYTNFCKVEVPTNLSRYKTAIDRFFSPQYPCQACLNWVEPSHLSSCFVELKLNSSGHFSSTEHGYELEVLRDVEYFEGSETLAGRPPFYVERWNCNSYKIILCNYCREKQTIKLKLEFI